MKEVNTTGVTLVTLFFSFGTLICCVIPVLFVSLGFGTVIVALITHFPILVTLSHYKTWLFVLSGSLLLISGWLLWYSARSCPTDPKTAALCERIQKWNKRIFWTATFIWSVGFVVTYVILPLWVWMEG